MLSYDFEPYLTDFLPALHDHPTRLVFEFAGAGAQAVRWLHSVGGSSHTVLEATDRYSPASLASLLGKQPSQFTSLTTAWAMAAQAFRRAGQLMLSQHLPDWSDIQPVIGVACTATIATSYAKRGQHRACVAVYDAAGWVGYELVLDKGRRDRQEEEALVSLLVLWTIEQRLGLLTEQIPLGFWEKAGVQRFDEDQLTAYADSDSLLTRLVSGQVEWILQLPSGQLLTGERLTGQAFLSGSFNPLHEGHTGLVASAAGRLGRTVSYELPIINADKAPLDLAELTRRAKQFLSVAPLFLTRLPLFSQKSNMFPKCQFVLGADTAVRLWHPRFYHDDEIEMAVALSQIRANGGRFVVGGRVKDSRFQTLTDLDCPPRFTDLFSQIPEAEFRQDISSTEIREMSPKGF